MVDREEDVEEEIIDLVLLEEEGEEVEEQEEIEESNKPLSKEHFKKCIPRGLKLTVTDKLLDEVNSVITNSTMGPEFKDNVLGFSSVLAEGRFKMGAYINAVKYVTYKMTGDSNIAAYIKTFPDRYQRLLDTATTEKAVSCYVSSYNKGALVTKILAQSLPPTHIINADIYQKAINTLATLMYSANSEKVRSDSASSLITHLKPPETKKVELDIGITDNTAVAELKAITVELAAQQRKNIALGISSAREIAHSTIVGELTEN